MLGKLMKFEFKSTYRSYLFLYSILLAVATMLSFRISEEYGKFDVMIIIIYTILITVISVFTFVNILKSYQNSMYGKNAYLTHTLPVTTNQLLVSKSIVAFVWILLSFGIVAISLLILFLPHLPNPLENIREAFEAVSNSPMYRNGYIVDALISLFFLVSSLFETIFLIYAIISFTHTKYVSRYRGFVGVTFYFGISLLRSFLFSNVDQINPMMLSNVSIATTMVAERASNVVSILVNVGFACLYYFITKYLIDKKMEVE
ncbi:MAG: hypothetical protein RR493_00755 [Erysipelotrichaceae bacterium]